MLVSPLPDEIAELKMETTARAKIGNKTQVHKSSFTSIGNSVKEHHGQRCISM